MFPYTPVLLGGDQVFFWIDAQRLIHGDRVYRDFFQFTGPGTDLIYLGAFHLFGPRTWVPNTIVLGLGVVFCWTCFRIGTMILPRSLSFLTAAVIVVLVYGKLLNATHHWFSELAVLTAVFVLIKGRWAVRIVLSGVLLGVATFFTQTRGPAAAFAIASYFLWEALRTSISWRISLKRSALLVLSLIVTWLTLSSYFIATIGWRQIWYWQVEYVMRYQVQDSQLLGLPNAFAWKNFLMTSQVVGIYLTLPLVLGTSLWYAWRSRRESLTQIEASRMLLTFVGVATTLEVAQSPNWLRVYCVAAPGIILGRWVVGHIDRHQRPARAALWTIVVCLAFQQIRAQHRTESTLVRLPAGEASTSHLKAEKLLWIEEHTKREDYFFQAAWPGVFFRFGCEIQCSRRHSATPM